MPAAYEIRLADRDDAHSIASLVEHVAPHTYAAIGDDRTVQAWLTQAATPHREILSGERSGLVLVAEGPGGLYGTAYVDLDSSRARDYGCDCYLGGWYVIAPGIGVGRSLLLTAVAAARAQFRSALAAEVYSQNRVAIGLLTQAGFEVAGDHPGRNFGSVMWVEMVKDLTVPTLPAPKC